MPTVGVRHPRKAGDAIKILETLMTGVDTSPEIARITGITTTRVGQFLSIMAGEKHIDRASSGSSKGIRWKWYANDKSPVFLNELQSIVSKRGQTPHGKKT